MSPDGKDTYTGSVTTEADGTNTDLYTRKALRVRRRCNSLHREQFTVAALRQRVAQWQRHLHWFGRNQYRWYQHKIREIEVEIEIEMDSEIKEK